MSGFKASTLSGTSSEDEADTNRGSRHALLPNHRKARAIHDHVPEKKLSMPSMTHVQQPLNRRESSPEMSPPSFYSVGHAAVKRRAETSESSPEASPAAGDFYFPNAAANTSESSPDTSPVKKRFYEQVDTKTNLKPPSATIDSSESFNDGPEMKAEKLYIPAKKRKIEGGIIKSKKAPQFNSVAQKLMEKMGYKEGTGLGKHSQGRVEIVEASKQRGRRGFGLHLAGLDARTDIDWEKEEVKLVETVEWIPECVEEPPDMQELRSWMVEGKKKLKIEDETNFCREEILKQVIQCKTVFDELDGEELRRARTRSNPFETIRGVIFQNRAAMKMANIDSLFGFMFTKPVTEVGEPVLGPNDLLYFADVCAGPGGFSEYILWKKKWEAKGFGFTLRGPNDFKLDEFFSGPPESFEPHYGVNGIDGNGDVFVPENLREFRRFVLENTDNKGVHFVMADGGFSVEGEENIQEILSKQLYLCQFLCALSILRQGGHFVCKVFDLFTLFSVGLIYLLYRAFKSICIVKPNTSRPANSERYVVCKWRRENVRDIHDYMFEVNCCLQQLKNSSSSEDVTEVVPMSVITSDIKFYEYIFTSNEKLAHVQAMHLAKIRAFCQNTDLYEERQSDLRRESLKLWEIPDKLRSAPNRSEPMTKFRELTKGEDIGHFSHVAEPLDLKKLQTIKSPYEYRCVVCSADKENKTDRGFFLGLGRTYVYKWNGLQSMRWTNANLSLVLPCDTLIYAEIVQELKGEGKGQRKITSLHIIDALFLGGRDVRAKNYTERIAEAQKFVKAVSQPSRPDLMPIRAKEVYRLEELNLIFDKLVQRIVKGGGLSRRLCYCCDSEKYFMPHGLLLIRIVRDPWTVAFSRSKNTKYFFNTRTRESRYDAPREAVASFRDCFSKRIFWSWELGVKVHDSHTTADEDKVHRETILQRLGELIPK